MRGAPWLAAAAVVVVAVVVLAWPQPAPERAGGESPLALALAADLASPGPGARFPCATCHYAFVDGFEVAALRTQTGARAWYNLTLQPVSGYELAVSWAAPRSEGDGLPDPLHVEQQVTVPLGGGTVRASFELPWQAAGLVAEVRPAPEDQARRPPLTLLLEGPSQPAAQDLGSVANKHAWALATPEAPLAGRWDALVTAADARDGLHALNVTFRAIPLGYEVRTDDGRATGTRGRAHAFAWDLPAPGLAGAPERVHVGVVAYNDHPVGNWSLPPEGDRALYEGNVSTSRTAPASGPPFTAAEVAARWGSEEARLLHEHTFDGLIARSLNDRGERTGQTLRVDLAECPPCDPPVFPPMPPGTTHVRALLTWEKRDPLAPDPAWRLAVTQRPEPDFRYPEPTEAAPGSLAWSLLVRPEEWEREGDGWLQVWPLLSPDAEGRTLFSGRYAFRVEALREAAPAP